MERSDLDRSVKEDLARIPRGGLSQNILRAVYNMQRRSDLAGRTGIPKRSVAQYLNRAGSPQRPNVRPIG